MYMWQEKSVPQVEEGFIKVTDVHGVQIDGKIEVYEEGAQNCGVRWTPKELMRIGAYLVTLNPMACSDDTRK